MEASTPVCNIPGRYGKAKWPKLQEAHTYLLGKPFDGAHGAMADTEACRRVFWALKNRENVE